MKEETIVSTTTSTTKSLENSKSIENNKSTYLCHNKPSFFKTRFKLLAGYPATVILVKLVEPVNQAKPVILDESEQYSHAWRHFLKRQKT